MGTPALIPPDPRPRPARHRSPPPRLPRATAAASTTTTTTAAETSTSPPQASASARRRRPPAGTAGPRGAVAAEDQNHDVVRRRVLRDLLDRDLPRRTDRPRGLPRLPAAQPAVRGLRRDAERGVPRRRVPAQRRRLGAGEFHEP
ncbi:unnamed protein product [Linum tenue]|uniref:Uncharacterized protein n=1 Tax=Linum tenue TaxID=586396 RepID=A0AAV0NV12_9ROSI|nr:unnamed protein product [Linum tenue]